MRVRALAALLLAPTLISVIAPAAQATTADPYDLLYIEGQAGDNLTPSSARTQTLVSPTHVAVVTPVGAGIKVAMKRVSDATMAVQTVTVVPPTGSALTTGGPFATTKTATADTWGLEVRSSSTCSASTGHVTIHELVLDPADSHVTSIALSYDQTCSAVGSKPVYGDVRVQSTRDYRTAAANATTLGFAGTILATTAAAKTVTVTAGGTTALATGPATLTGDSAADYAISDDTCAPAPVAPASTCTVSVTFTPSTRGAHP
ncbi:MAG: hypothetical protein QOK42_789, partial [Frankiaceae bacterium]|nr:hypothetical protein [Frankiaceae bacterium]